METILGRVVASIKNLCRSVTNSHNGRAEFEILFAFLRKTLRNGGKIMKCPSCGAELLEGRSFCSMCGAGVSENTYQQQSEASRQPYQQPTQQTYSDGTPVVPAEYQPISPWGYIGYMLLFSLPCVGFIVMCVFAFGSQKNVNVKNFARGYFYLWLIMIVLYIFVCIALFTILAMAGTGMEDFVEEFSRELSMM